jgi:O-antigen/teichoic acid export membrane protein
MVAAVKKAWNWYFRYTYRYEYAFVLGVLLIPFAFADHIRLTEIVVTAAVFVTFMHASVSDRMQERQALMEKPDVECYAKSNRFFMIKEALWITFFIMIKSWGALLGAVIFFLYPFWRKWYRKRYPLNRNAA